jgi:hypothetical protein
MKVGGNVYKTWVRGQAVAIAWVGALIFPLAFLMPVDSMMFWICLLLGVFVTWSIIEGVRLAKHRPLSDFLAKTVVPAFLLLVSTGWVAWGFVAA